MKKLWVFCLFLFIGLSLQAQQMSQRDVEQAEVAAFTANLHPFLRNNCTHCHAENSAYTTLAKHSQMNPNLAFSVMKKFIDFKDLDESKLVKMVNSAHYCEYGINCDRIDEVKKDFKLAFAGFKSAVSNIVRPVVTEPIDALGKTIGNAQANSYVFPSNKIDGKSFLVSAEEDFSFSFPFVPLILDGSSNLPIPTITAEFKKLGNSYYQLRSLSLTAQDGIYAIRGVRLLVNDQSTDRSGMENIRRFIYFKDLIKEEKKLITSAHPIIKINPGDRIRFAFDGIGPLSEVPSDSICMKTTVPSFQRALNDGTNYDAQRAALIDYAVFELKVQTKKRLPNFFAAVKSDILLTEECLHVESEIDFQNPARSILLERFRQTQNPNLEGTLPQLTEFMEKIEALVELKTNQPQLP